MDPRSQADDRQNQGRCQSRVRSEMRAATVSSLNPQPRAAAKLEPVVRLLVYRWIEVHAGLFSLSSNQARNFTCARASCDFEKLLERPNCLAISSWE